MDEKFSEKEENAHDFQGNRLVVDLKKKKQIWVGWLITSVKKVVANQWEYSCDVITLDLNLCNMSKYAESNHAS